MARPSNTEARRAQIVDGMRASVARLGYDGASVAEIARAARLAPGLVHYHFEDKRHILLALLARLAAEATDRVARAVESAGTDPRRRLGACVDTLLARGDGADPEAVACWIAIAAEAIRDPTVRRAFHAELARMAAGLEALVGAAAPRPRRDARAIACLLLAALQGYFLISATAPALVPAGSAARLVGEAARHLTGSSSAATRKGARR